MRPELPGLWRHRDFMRLWVGQTISAFGSMVGATALSFTAILFLHATPLQLGILASSQLVPGLLTSLFAGAWVDRLARRPILIAMDLGRAVALISIPAAAYFHVLRMEHLYVVTFLASILTIFFDVAYQSYLPSLVSKEELIEGNSKLTASAAISEFVGFGISGWLVQLFSAPIAVLIDSVSFVVSAVYVGSIAATEPPPAFAEQRDMRREIVEGMREVAHSPLLRPIAICTISKSLAGGVYGALVVLYMSRGLGFNPGLLGMIWALGGISSFFGAVLAERVASRLGMGPTMIYCMIIAGVSMFFIPLAQGATVLSAALLILPQLTGDGPATIYEITKVSLQQSIAPERMLGRVSASMKFIGLAAALAGSMLGGALGGKIGVRATLALAAGWCLLSTLWLVFSPVRNLVAARNPALEPVEAV